MNHSKITCGLIVSYNPDENIIQSAKELINQVDKLVIVDNGSSDDSSLSYIDTLKTLNANILFISNKNNLGIAAALNQGINLAIERKYEWLVTFDQDTLVPNNFISSLFSCYDTIQSQKNVAILCPVRINNISTQEDLLESSLYRYISSTMTSGSLMKISAIKDIGMFDEDLFIDWVDHDYCMRAKVAKYKIVQSISTPLFHVAGEIKQHLFFSKKVPTSNHSALRRYYMSRNRAICYKRYLFVDTIFVIDDFLLALREVIKIIFFEDDKLNKLSMTCIGIKDAFFSRTGIYSKSIN